MINPSISIRPFSSAPHGDIIAVTAIYAHHVTHGKASYETTPPTLADMTGRFAALTDNAYPVLVAEQNGVVIGYAYAGPHKPRNGYRYTVEDSVYVAPDAIGCGVGTQLLTALIDAATKCGYRQMMAVIGGPVTASVALHKSCGFREIGRAYELGYKFGEWLDTLYMQRALQPQSKGFKEQNPDDLKKN